MSLFSFEGLHGFLREYFVSLAGGITGVGFLKSDLRTGSDQNEK